MHLRPAAVMAQHPRKMKVCVYGSSSKATPEKYLAAAYELGEPLLFQKRTEMTLNPAKKHKGGCWPWGVTRASTVLGPTAPWGR